MIRKYGMFHCKKCGNRWGSRYALKERRKTWRMKCKRCMDKHGSARLIGPYKMVSVFEVCLISSRYSSMRHRQKNIDAAKLVDIDKIYVKSVLLLEATAV